MSNKRTRRPADVLLAELQAKQQKLMVKSKLEQAKANPILLPLLSALADINKGIAINQRQFANGPQSFDSRRKQHELWLAEINAAEYASQIARQDLNGDKSYLTGAIQSIADRISAGEDVTDSILNVTDSIGRATPEFKVASTNLEIARNARKSFKDQFDKDQPEFNAEAEENLLG